MPITRRQFNRRLAAAAASVPFLNPRAFAADAPARRLVLIWSLGTDNTLWRPTSAPGAALALSECLAPMAPIQDQLMVVDGLSFVDPNNQHSTWQPFTGATASQSGLRGKSISSIDQYILAKQPAVTRVPFVGLGVQAKNEGQFIRDNQRLVPNDDPANAFQTLFGGAQATPPPAMNTGGKAAPEMPRKAIVDQVRGELKELQQLLGSGAKGRLDQHLDALAQLEKNAAPIQAGGSCQPKAPMLSGGPEDAQATLDNGVAHFDLIAQALACDLTRVATLQWGISNNQSIKTPSGVIEEHGQGVHSNDKKAIIACESTLSKAFADFIAKLKATADPSGQGTLLDNTLVYWTRDMGAASQHTQFAIPTVLAGGGGYLATKPGGAYVRLDGDDASGKKSSQTHDAVLLNLAEWMGVTDYGGFGVQAGASKPLAQVKGG